MTDYDKHTQRSTISFDLRLPLSFVSVCARVFFFVATQPRSLVVMCHLAVQRCLFAYFMGVEISKVPHIDLPIHHLTELTPSPFGTSCRHVSEMEMMSHF